MSDESTLEQLIGGFIFGKFLGALITILPFFNKLSDNLELANSFLAVLLTQIISLNPMHLGLGIIFAIVVALQTR